MAQKKIQKSDIEFAMMQDFYKLYQDYFIPEDSDEWWEDVIHSVSSFMKKYSSVPLSRGLGNALMQSIEKESKNEST